jgi:hypothetical protein
MIGIRFCLVLALLTCLTPGGLLAAPPAGSEAVAAAWNQGFEETERLLAEGRWQPALERADALAAEMTHQIVTGDGAAVLLGKVSRLRALAYAGLGAKREALWDWAVARQLAPELDGDPLDGYGEAGRLLKAGQADPLLLLGDGAGDAKPACENVTPPRKVHAPNPEFPEAQRGHPERSPVQLIVQTIVDRQGVPQSPRILKMTGEPVFVLASLAALREWRFEPARCKGEPVETYYNLALSFSTEKEERGRRRRGRRGRGTQP